MHGRLTTESLAFSSREYLRLIEDAGLTGTWGWTFATNAHVWSPGLYRLLGLELSAVSPSYDLLRQFTHPEDRPCIETEARVRLDGILSERTFRVVRPDGSVRLLSCRPEVYFLPDGRPRGAVGLLLDVTDQAALTRAHALQQRERRAHFEHTHCFQFSSELDGTSAFPSEMISLMGIPAVELAANNWLAIAPEERDYWYEFGNSSLSGSSLFLTKPLGYVAGIGPRRYHVVTVPVRDARENLVEWYSVSHPEGGRFAPTDRALQALEQSVRGRHLRAGRALLGWAMMDLARASGLSFSTVRRLEEDGEATAARSRHRAIDALRTAGIRFSLLDGNTIAVSKT